ncbi:MAG: TlyA family RNA methyltransferase [Opitutaceae bacterium]
MATERKRLDQIVVDRGWSESRSQAKAMIMAGRVWQGTERMTKAGAMIPVDAELRFEGGPRFVGRGAEKLEAFLDRFGIKVAGLCSLDVGASTGGFTDCLLQRGVVEATCIDVGRAQLHPRILNDPRVTNLERVNARHLKPGDLPRDAYSVIVIDVSFISLRSILPPVWAFLEPGGILVALVKPQFEAGRDAVSRGRGVIRDVRLRRKIFGSIREMALADLPAAVLVGEMESPLEGADGNREGLLGLRKAAATQGVE